MLSGGSSKCYLNNPHSNASAGRHSWEPPSPPDFVNVAIGTCAGASPGTQCQHTSSWSCKAPRLACCFGVRRLQLVGGMWRPGLCRDRQEPQTRAVQHLLGCTNAPLLERLQHDGAPRGTVLPVLLPDEHDRAVVSGPPRRLCHAPANLPRADDDVRVHATVVTFTHARASHSHVQLPIFTRAVACSRLDINADLCAGRNYHSTMLAHGATSHLALVPKEDERCAPLG